MTIKELIIELLEYDIDATVDIDVRTSEDDVSESDFSLDENGRYLTFTIEPKDFVLVDKDDFRELHERIEELENE